MSGESSEDSSEDSVMVESSEDSSEEDSVTEDWWIEDSSVDSVTIDTVDWSIGECARWGGCGNLGETCRSCRSTRTTRITYKPYLGVCPYCFGVGDLDDVCFRCSDFTVLYKFEVYRG
jgi:hypothetical protein